MSLHAIAGPGGSAQFLLHPARDMGHNFPTILRQACKMAGVPWSTMVRVLGACGSNPAEVQAGLEALGRFVQAQPDGLEPDSNSRDMNASVKASGFLDCAPAGQIVALALVGRACMAMFWQGVRDVSEGVQPSAKYASLWEAIQQASHLLSGQKPAKTKTADEGFVGGEGEG